MISKSILAVSALAGLALAEPLATPAAQLNERAIDPAFVGFISQSGSCTYPCRTYSFMYANHSDHQPFS